MNGASQLWPGTLLHSAASLKRSELCTTSQRGNRWDNDFNVQREMSRLRTSELKVD
jgi:hypothetical protein